MELEVNKNGPTTPVPPVVLPQDIEVAEKVYHTRLPGSNFIMPDGQVHSFNGAGHLTTTSKNLQLELDRISDKGGSPIFTKAAAVVLPSDLAPVVDIQARAADVIQQLKLQQNQQLGG